MSYSGDIQNFLSPALLYTFNNTLVDAVSGSSLWGAGSSDFATTLISRDTTHSLRTNATSENPALTTVDPWTQGNPKKFWCMWYRVSAIQGPPVCVYREGGSSAGFALILWAGNNIMLQVWDNSGSDLKQVYCDAQLQNNRNYHLAVSIEDDTGGDFVKFYIDGKEQTSSFPTGGLGVTLTKWTGNPEIGNTASGDIPVGDGVVLLVATVTGNYSHMGYWAETSGATGSVPAYDDWYEHAFSRGAISEYTITSDTEANMQTALDALSGTVCGDYPLSILVEEVSGGGDLDLTADNITFDPKSSLHVRYDTTGGTLTWTNDNGSDASIGTSGVTFINNFNLTFTNVKNPTEIRVFEAGTTTELAGEEDITGGTFSKTIGASSIDVRIVSLDYKILQYNNLSMTSDLSISLEQFYDRNYSNPV